ncbi:hypothetical protein LZ198_18675 [Myxococcus sp. K15C18031901]|uniref:hypothetical protein n=1 Tax=Myxococcus dinghuensis TaxID=2906761 RepID=UPI0020A6E310|nr:hypothetical protein [Myxococcus dinghuensis]MCP3100900.1 hypothetical protein [Myxococcus dinghuensis]
MRTRLVALALVGWVGAAAPVHAESARDARSAQAKPSVSTGARSSAKQPPAPVGARAGAKAPASAPTKRFAWPSLTVLEQVDASEVIEAGGVPVVLRAVVVKEPIQALVQRFADAFRDGGLHVPPGNEQPQLASGAAMLTAVDIFQGLTYTVILQPRSPTLTLVYLGEANHALRREPSAEGDVAPMPPGSRDALRVSDEGSRTLSFLVPMSSTDLQAYYARELTRAGWRLAEGERALYTRPGEELRIVDEAAASGLRSVVLLHRRARASDAAPAP